MRYSTCAFQLYFTLVHPWAFCLQRFSPRGSRPRLSTTPSPHALASRRFTRGASSTRSRSVPLFRLRVRQNSNRVALSQHRCFDLSRLRVSNLGVSHLNATLGALLISTLHADALQTSIHSTLCVVMLQPSTSLHSLCLRTPSFVLSSASSPRAPNLDLSATFHTSLLKFWLAAFSNTEMLESTTDLARIAHTPDVHSLSSLRLRTPSSTSLFLTHSHASSFDRRCFRTVRQRQLHFRSADFLIKRYFTLNGSITVTFTSPSPPSRST